MKKEIFQKIRKELPEAKRDVLLKNYTTFKIGGPAKYFFVAKTKDDLIKAISVAKRFNLPFFILGSGSNILISDKGFKGLVIKNETRNFKIKKERIIAESGAIFDRIILNVIQAGLSGLEKGSGIPGTLGGAVYGNAGWPRGAWAIGDAVESVTLLMPDGKIKKTDKKWFSFSYRNSRLKIIKGEKPVILEVILKLKKGKIKDLKKKRQEILKKRVEKIPSGFSAGSIFINPRQNTAGYLIEKCGLKGKKIGRVQISEKHANFIVNLGEGKARDVKKLINLVKKSVKNKFGIVLEEENQYLGF
jgi:UDP-N-acetylmuramate dehydrogenase